MPPIPPRHKRQAAHRLGMDAESLAAEYLRRKKLKILAERLRTAGGEIDVLALEGKTTLVVVEVKARATLDDSLYSITPAKRKRLIRAAEAVLAMVQEGQLPHQELIGQADLTTLNIRFDVVAVAQDVPPMHLVDAWQVE